MALWSVMLLVVKQCCTILRDGAVADGSEGGMAERVDSIVRGNGGGSASVGDVGVMMMW